MKRMSFAVGLCCTTILGTACAGMGSQEKAAAVYANVTARMSSITIDDPLSPLARIDLLTDEGGRVDWSHSADRIAFDRRGDDGFYDVYTMKPDGSEQQCLTCTNAAFERRNTGNPVWHPSGGFIVFQSQKRFQLMPAKFSEPGRGANNDLWVMRSDGTGAKALVRTKRLRGVLHPHFSKDGTKLCWAEKEGSKNWALKVADIVMDASGLQTETTATYRPGTASFYETHGFSQDGETLLFSADIEGQGLRGLDIYTLNTRTEELVNLTNTPNQWDEHAHFSPSGSRIVWMSSRNNNTGAYKIPDLKTDLWIMNADGSGKQRLTYFNQPGRPEYTGEQIVVGDSTWSRDGKQLVSYLILPVAGTIKYNGRNVLITFKKPQ